MAASPTLAIRAPGSPPSIKQEPLTVDATPNFKISADSALNGSSADARAADNERPPTTASPSPTVQEPESKESNTRGGSVADSSGAGKGDSFRDRQAKVLTRSLLIVSYSCSCLVRVAVPTWSRLYSSVRRAGVPLLPAQAEKRVLNQDLNFAQLLLERGLAKFSSTFLHHPCWSGRRSFQLI